MLSLISHLLLACTFTAAVLAQIDFKGLPQCAQAPVLGTIGKSKCDPSRPSCICTDDSVVNELFAMVVKACSGDDLAKAIGFGRSLCPNLASQNVATITDSKTTYTITLKSHMSTTAAPATTTSAAGTSTTEAPSTTESQPGADGEEPTASVTAATNGTVNGTGNGTIPEPYMGDAPEFGPMRLWSMVLGIVLMAVVFAEM